ncbi:hypothetical protein LCGC14_0192500 [marine sediment metagenome]|uniref:Uncharacterized protein n=1 Tax=marine sediment metagenome TaxID=412755 RepID=A0A0F9X558_9ZZZZ
MNNYMNGTSDSVVTYGLIGLVGGGIATGVPKSASAIISNYAPVRIGAGPLDPTKAALLQNLGRPNPYPAAVGDALGTSVGWGIPFAYDRINKEFHESNR